MQVRCICSSNHEYRYYMGKLVDKFVNKDNDRQELEKTGNGVRIISRNIATQIKNKSTPDNVKYISTYDCHARIIQSAIRNLGTCYRTILNMASYLPNVPNSSVAEAKTLVIILSSPI